ncbi:MAG TPA: hypothetical protein VKF35_18815 [Hyphomicrobiaceae bacterium]|nr:hypothetical protein [Hyphomicrobiaceae bacterium]
MLILAVIAFQLYGIVAGGGAEVSDTWQPISTAPRDGTKVIVREGTRICVAAFERPNFSPTAPEAWVLYVDYGYGLPGEKIDEHRHSSGGWDTIIHPTHWKPI